jgi:hypothetical protein
MYLIRPTQVILGDWSKVIFPYFSVRCETTHDTPISKVG